jgi:hypothetical protein
MSESICSYKDLLEEKQRLEVLLVEQRQVLRSDVQELKAQLEPLRRVVEFIRKITTKDKTAFLLTIGSDIVINSVVKRFILSRAGWFVRNVVPYFLKNYSSHFLSEQKDKWIEKLRAWLGHKNGEQDESEKPHEKGETTGENK